jgi:hypothetical protein
MVRRLSAPPAPSARLASRELTRGAARVPTHPPPQAQALQPEASLDDERFEDLQPFKGGFTAVAQPSGAARGARRVAPPAGSQGVGGLDRSLTPVQESGSLGGSPSSGWVAGVPWHAMIN